VKLATSTESESFESAYLPASVLTRNSCRYGDHLYGKGDYEGAMSCYLKTVGTVQASYVIRKVRTPFNSPRDRACLTLNFTVPRRSTTHSSHFLPTRTPFSQASKQRYNDSPPQLLHETRRRRSFVPIHPFFFSLLLSNSTQHKWGRSRRSSLRSRNRYPCPSTSFLFLACYLARSTISTSFRIPTDINRRYFRLSRGIGVCRRSREE